MIFSTLWFNALLVLLALSSGAAFFSRIWKRKLTLLSVGMILFHVSFLALLAGVVYDGLFHFKGTMRLTEGETLPNGNPESYDLVEYGRFFHFSRLRGETTLKAMHRGYRVDGQDKRAAYELPWRTASGGRKARSTSTRHLDFDGVRYFPSKEGYSLLVLLKDGDGKVEYGAYVPAPEPEAAGRRLSLRDGVGDRAVVLSVPAAARAPPRGVAADLPAERRDGSDRRCRTPGSADRRRRDGWRRAGWQGDRRRDVRRGRVFAVAE